MNWVVLPTLGTSFSPDFYSLDLDGVFEVVCLYLIVVHVANHGTSTRHPKANMPKANITCPFQRLAWKTTHTHRPFQTYTHTSLKRATESSNKSGLLESTEKSWWSTILQISPQLGNPLRPGISLGTNPALRTLLYPSWVQQFVATELQSQTRSGVHC